MKVQVVFSIIITILSYFIFGKQWVIPIILGAMSSIVPSFLCKKIFLHGVCSQKKPEARLKQFYLAEIIKIASIILFFVLCLWVFKVNPFVFFLGFVIVQILGWILNLLQLRKS